MAERRKKSRFENDCKSYMTNKVLLYGDTSESKEVVEYE